MKTSTFLLLGAAVAGGAFLIHRSRKKAEDKPETADPKPTDAEKGERILQQGSFALL